ncbi:hypothetical protein GM708_08780 [Vibrio cholerae]|nr:hypothetical protein [Vibrio cholerae]
MGVMDARGAYHVVPAVAGTVLALLLLTGCQGDADPSDTGTAGQPSASAAPTAAEASGTPSPASSAGPSPASSLGPAANLPVPVKPALADENSKEGLEAFTRYWFELFSHGYATNDWAPFEAVTDPGCRTCGKYVEIVQGIYQQGQYVRGGDFFVEEFGTDFVVNTQGSVQAFVTNGQSDITFYGSDGVAIRTDEAPDSVVDVVFAVHVDGSWLLLDYGKPEGT